MSRWSNWSRGSKPPKMLSDFLKEGPIDPARTGNPTGTGQLSPADRAKQLGLQSNGKGGYIDPKTGQVVARTINNELVFYSSAPGGGAVSDGSGGAAMARPSSAWQDPISGLMVTPPGKPETPNEIAAIPDPVPSQAPAGYNNFIHQRKQDLYLQDKQARDEQEQQAQLAQMMPPAPEQAPMGGMSMPEPAMPPMAQENYTPGDLLKRSGGMGPPSFSELRDKMKATQQPKQEVQPETQQQAQQVMPEPERDAEDHKDEISALSNIVNDSSDLESTVRDYHGQLMDNDKKLARFMDKKYAPFAQALQRQPADRQEAFRNLVMNAYKFGGRVNTGAGLNSLGKADVEQLMNAKGRLLDGVDYDKLEQVQDMVRSTRQFNDIDPEFLKLSYAALPPALRNAWNNKGNAGKGEFGQNHFLGYDENGEALRGQLGKNARGMLTWLYYLQQGGRDGYTGLPINIDNFDIEHVLPGSGAKDLDDFKNREHELNHLLVNSNVNQAKGDLSMKDFFEQKVMPFADKDDEFWENRDKILDFRNQIGDVEDNLAKTILNEDNDFSEGLSLPALMSHFDNEDKRLKGEKKHLMKFAKELGDPEILREAKKIETMSGIGKTLAKRLGLPRGYNKQKNVPGAKMRTNSIGGDNYYRAVIASMIGKDPERRQQIMDTYKSAIRNAEDATAPGYGGLNEFIQTMTGEGGLDPEVLEAYPKLKKLYTLAQEQQEEIDIEMFTEFLLERYHYENL